MFLQGVLGLGDALPSCCYLSDFQAAFAEIYQIIQAGDPLRGSVSVTVHAKIAETCRIDFIILLIFIEINYRQFVLFLKVILGITTGKRICLVEIEEEDIEGCLKAVDKESLQFEDAFCK